MRAFELPAGSVALLFLSIQGAVHESIPTQANLDKVANDRYKREDIHDLVHGQVLNLFLGGFKEFVAMLGNLLTQLAQLLSDIIFSLLCSPDHLIESVTAKFESLCDHHERCLFNV